MRKLRARFGVVGILSLFIVVMVSQATSNVGADPVTFDVTCNIGATTASGIELVSRTLDETIRTIPIKLAIPGDVTASETVAPGGAISYHGSMTIDLQAIANDLLINQVKPGIASNPAAAAMPGIENTAWINLTLNNVVAHFPIPAATTLSGSPSVTSTGAAATVAVNGGSVDVSVAQLSVGSYQLDPTAPQNGTTSTSRPVLNPFTTSLNFSATATGPAGTYVDLLPGNLDFDLAVEIGLYAGVEGSRLLIAGGVTGPASCAPDNPALILADTAVLNPGDTTIERETTTTTEEPATSTTTTIPPASVLGIAVTADPSFTG